MSSLQVEMAIAAIILLIIIVLSLKRNSMSIKNSVAWLLLPIAFIVIAIFPGPFADFANWLGFETLANFIFVVIIALLIILCFSLTHTVSRLQSQITTLIQELSIMKEKQNDKKSRK